MMECWSKRNIGIISQTDERWHLSESISLETHIWPTWPMAYPRGRRHEFQEYPMLSLDAAENEETDIIKST